MQAQPPHEFNSSSSPIRCRGAYKLRPFLPAVPLSKPCRQDTKGFLPSAAAIAATEASEPGSTRYAQVRAGKEWSAETAEIPLDVFLGFLNPYRLAGGSRQVRALLLTRRRRHWWNPQPASSIQAKSSER